jgi:tetratricopeptide (TPR) repeat protein
MILQVGVEELAKGSRRTALLSGLGAVLVLASLFYASTQLSRLAAERTRLAAIRDTALADLHTVRDSLTTAKSELSNTRCALGNSRAAINAFHSNNYEDAIALYDQALTCDPANAYLLNLRAYAQFKAGRLTAAIESQQRSVAADSSYAWGYFDLARFLCAAGASQGARARDAIQRALRLQPGLARTMRSDGEFTRLCRSELSTIP